MSDTFFQKTPLCAHIYCQICGKMICILKYLWVWVTADINLRRLSWQCQMLGLQCPEPAHNVQNWLAMGWTQHADLQFLCGLLKVCLLTQSRQDDPILPQKQQQYGIWVSKYHVVYLPLEFSLPLVWPRHFHPLIVLIKFKFLFRNSCYLTL